MNWILSCRGLGELGSRRREDGEWPNGFMCVSKFTPRNRDEWTQDTRRGPNDP